jgi:phospholipase C
MARHSWRAGPKLMLVGAVVIATLFALPAQDLLVVPSTPASGLTVDRLALGYQFRAHIQHIVVVMLENHAYDNYFATYCTVRGTYCSHVADGEPAGLCIPFNPNNTKAGCVKPFPFTPVNWTLTSQLPHGWTAANGDYQNGSMDGWYPSETSGLDPFGYYNGTTAPFFWDLAEQYGLGDHFFSSTMGYSLPNHWHLVAGTGPNESISHLFGASRNAQRKANDSLYLSQANSTRSVQDLLLNSTTSWSWYDHILGSYSRAIQDTAGKLGVAYSYYNPQAAKAESYNSSFNRHYVNNTQFYSDAANGTLPAVSWVIPTIAESDHPPSNVTYAESFLASIVNAVESSPNWNTTAMYISWDDFGGFYDHVSPRHLAGTQTNNLTGFRVPLIVISPYSRVNYVTHDYGYFESLLHLIEWRFGLGCLTPVDCGAPIPFDYFNFSQTPRAPILFSTNVSGWSYPMPLQAPSVPQPSPHGPYVPPAAFRSMSGAATGEEID